MATWMLISILMIVIFLTSYKPVKLSTLPPHDHLRPFQTKSLQKVVDSRNEYFVMWRQFDIVPAYIFTKKSTFTFKVTPQSRRLRFKFVAEGNIPLNITL